MKRYAYFCPDPDCLIQNRNKKKRKQIISCFGPGVFVYNTDDHNNKALQIYIYFLLIAYIISTLYF